MGKVTIEYNDPRFPVGAASNELVLRVLYLLKIHGIDMDSIQIKARHVTGKPT